MDSTATAGPVYVFAAPILTPTNTTELVPVSNSITQISSNVSGGDYVNTVRRPEVKFFFGYFLLFSYFFSIWKWKSLLAYESFNRLIFVFMCARDR